MFWQKKPEEVSRDELITFAVQYFMKYQGELDSGAVKATRGHLHITVSFIVDEKKGGE